MEPNQVWTQSTIVSARFVSPSLMSFGVDLLAPAVRQMPGVGSAIDYLTGFWLANAHKNINGCRNKFAQYIRKAQHEQRRANSDGLNRLLKIRP